MTNHDDNVPEIMREFLEQYNKKIKAPDFKPGDVVSLSSGDSVSAFLLNEGANIVTDVCKGIDDINKEVGNNEFGAVIIVVSNGKGTSIGKVHGIDNRLGWMAAFGMFMCYLKDHMNLDEAEDFRKGFNQHLDYLIEEKRKSSGE